MAKVFCNEIPEGGIKGTVDVIVAMEELEEAVIQYLANNYGLDRDYLEMCQQEISIGSCRIEILGQRHCIDIKSDTQTSAITIKNYKSEGGN